MLLYMDQVLVWPSGYVNLAVSLGFGMPMLQVTTGIIACPACKGADHVRKLRLFVDLRGL